MTLDCKILTLPDLLPSCRQAEVFKAPFFHKISNPAESLSIDTSTKIGAADIPVNQAQTLFSSAKIVASINSAAVPQRGKIPIYFANFIPSTVAQSAALVCRPVGQLDGKSSYDKYTAPKGTDRASRQAKITETMCFRSYGFFPGQICGSERGLPVTDGDDGDTGSSGSVDSHPGCLRLTLVTLTLVSPSFVIND